MKSSLPDKFPSRLDQFSAGLLSNSSLADIILIAHGKVPYWAHRLVLCAGSHVFKEMLMKRPQENLTSIPLEHIQPEDLQSILEFLYLGETTVPLDKIQDLMKAAKSLQILDFDVEEQGEETETDQGWEEDYESAACTSMTWKRRGSRTKEESQGPALSSPVTPVTSRPIWRRIRGFRGTPQAKGSPATPNTTPVKKEKEEIPLGTCPICNRSMKMTMLERHAGQTSNRSLIT